MSTEARNERSRNLHRKGVREILQLINEEDRKVPRAVENALPAIEEAVERYVESFRSGGTVYYVGAGTSGRLGVLDSAEMPPTFGVPRGKVVGLLAGGKEAIISAKEGSEDNTRAGRKLITEHDMTEKDFVIGISANGGTPFVLSCVEEAAEQGIPTAAVVNNEETRIGRVADIPMVAVTGPEVIAGSTRMKAGSAQKMILNMLSTTAMIQLGKVYDNLMVDLVAKNDKLRERAENILTELTGANTKEIEEQLEKTHYQVKPALLALKCGVSVDVAIATLDQYHGFLEPAIKHLEDEKE